MAQPVHARGPSWPSQSHGLVLAPPLPGAVEAACFELHPDPQLVVNAESEVVASNRAAQALIEEEQGPRALAERLVAGGTDALHELRAHILAAIRSQRLSPELEIRLSASVRLAVRVCPLGPALDCALLVVRRQETRDVRAARERFGFTPAESVVAERLSHGLTAAQIARELGISIETVRCHLKQAFAKAGVHRQAELVAVMLGG